MSGGMVTVADRTDTRQRLVEMRARLLDDLDEQIDGGAITLLAAVNGAIAAIDAAPVATDAAPASRAVVSDDASTITLTLYADSGALATVELDVHRAVYLAGRLIDAAGRRL